MSARTFAALISVSTAEMRCDGEKRQLIGRLLPVAEVTAEEQAAYAAQTATDAAGLDELSLRDKKPAAVRFA